MNDDQKAVCARAVDHFGRRAQLRKVAEELRELAVECEKAAEGGHTSPEALNALTEALAHERADVQIMLYQFDNLLLPSISRLVPGKIASQIERLERRLEDGERSREAVQGGGMIPRSWAEKPYSEWVDEDLRDCARWWAEELGLSSWAITAVFESRYIVEGLARCKYNARTESAAIRVTLWAERDHADPVENGVEEDIVHELLHARFWAIDQPGTADTAESAMFELAIDRTAHALVRQRRHGR